MTTKFVYEINGNSNDVKVKLSEILTTEIKKTYVKTSWEKNELIIKIEKMGSSEIRIKLSDQNDKCIIQESKRSVAMMHKPFIGEVEKIVDHLLIQKMNASKVS